MSELPELHKGDPRLARLEERIWDVINEIDQSVPVASVSGVLGMVRHRLEHDAIYGDPDER